MEVADSYSRRWQKALQYEKEQRHHLEDTIEQLAKQHNSLERAWREKPSSYTGDRNGAFLLIGLDIDIFDQDEACPPVFVAAGVERSQEEGDSDENDEFFDAMEDSPAFITVTAGGSSVQRR